MCQTQGPLAASMHFAETWLVAHEGVTTRPTHPVLLFLADFTPPRPPSMSDANVEGVGVQVPPIACYR